MIARCVLVVSTVFLLASGAGARDDKKDEKEKFQGEWALVSMDVSGTKMAEGWVKRAKLVVKGSQWKAKQPSGDREFTFRIDPTKRPKELDLLSEMNGKEMTWRGIYRLEGDTLTFCRSREPGGERPKEFKARVDAVLIVYKRSGD